MSTSTSLYARDPGAVMQALEQLVSRRSAQRLFRACGGSAAQAIELARSRGGRAWARLAAAQSLHEHALLEIAAQGPALTSPDVMRPFLSRTLGTLPYEMFSVILLNNRHQLIGMRELFRGTIDGASVHPREVIREALAHNAAAVVLAHNHPSGVAEPSQADELITRRLKEALALLDIRVLDHFIVGGSQCLSFNERGLI